MLLIKELSVVAAPAADTKLLQCAELVFHELQALLSCASRIQKLPLYLHVHKLAYVWPWPTFKCCHQSLCAK
jgi:hypothetical protein